MAEGENFAESLQCLEGQAFFQAASECEHMLYTRYWKRTL